MKEIKTIEPIQKINNKRSNKKVRVAVYVRVSTKSIEQEGSFEMQKDAYINMIKKIPTDKKKIIKNTKNVAIDEIYSWKE